MVVRYGETGSRNGLVYVRVCTKETVSRKGKLGRLPVRREGEQARGGGDEKGGENKGGEWKARVGEAEVEVGEMEEELVVNFVGWEEGGGE